MKNIKYSALVAIAAIAASCAKESTVIEKETIKDIPMEPMCIQTGDESETKTSLNGQTVNWTEGDQIAVYSNMDYSTGYKFSATNIKDINRNTATFSGEVPAGTESFFAVYPPERVSSASASGAVVTIPSDQTSAAGTFYEELNITIAKGRKTPGKSDVGTIRFRNVCSYVKFTVPAYVSDVKSVKISSDNAIAGNLTVDYTGENPSSTIAPDGAKSISMSGSFGAGETFIFVIAPGTVSNFSIDIKTASGNWTRTVSSGFTATAGKPVNLGTVHFKIASMTAKAKHTYDGETLTGTNLVIENLNIPNSLTGYVERVHIDIIPEGKTTAVRSADIDNKDFSTQTSIAVNSEAYPYLPQGKYTIKSTYTMSDGTTSRETTGSFSVDAPTFTVNTPSAHTSYDTYKTSGADEANKEDGSTIYISNKEVTISDIILNNDNYASASIIGGYSYTIDGEDATLDANGNPTNVSWGAHKVVAKFTFDGVTVSMSSPALTCHVTGLPYRAPSETKFNASGKSWTKISGYGTSINADNVVLRATVAPKAYSPTFHIPSNINVKINNTATRNKIGSGYTYALNLYDGSNTGTSIISEEIGRGATKNYSELPATMTNTYNKIIASYSYSLEGNYITINKFEILYR